VTSTYIYNADGIRIGKNSGGVVTEYVLNGTLILAEKRGDTIIRYIYDENGLPVGMILDGTTYLYEKNLQGDVIGIYTTSGTKVVTYVYDAWGKTVSSSYVSGYSNVYTYNPFRYRGYYYDTETGFYYLQSRYYDPAIGRFINADGYLSTGTGLIGCNMYAYCNNNPVMYVDYTGMAWWHWAIGAGIVAACAVATVVTCGGFAAAVTAVSMVGSGVAAATTASTIAAGAFIGSVTALGTAAIAAVSTSDSVEEFNDQGNWGTVATTALGAVTGGAKGYSMAKAQIPSSNSTNASRGSTGRTEPSDLREQLAMEQVKSNPSAGTQLTRITLNDPRWPSSEGWVKMQQIVPTSQGNINIHYVYSQTLNVFDDFKFKS